MDYHDFVFIYLLSIFISSVIYWLFSRILFSCHVCVFFSCCCSVFKSCPTLCDPKDCSMPRSPVLHYLPEFAQIYVHWVLWCYLTISSSDTPFSLCLQSFPPTRSLPKELALCIRWPKYWIFTFSISPANEYSGVISFRIDWLDCHAVQQTLKFFIVQLSHLYLTTGKPRALTIQIFVSKVMSLLFNILPRFFIAFLPNSKHLLISWLQSPSAGILEPKKIKSVTASTFPPSICHEVMRLDAMIFVFWMLSSEPAFSLLFHPHQEAL